MARSRSPRERMWGQKGRGGGDLRAILLAHPEADRPSTQF